MSSRRWFELAGGYISTNPLHNSGNYLYVGLTPEAQPHLNLINIEFWPTGGKSTSEYCQRIAKPIYAAAYSLREEFEALILLKVQLDVLHEKGSAKYTHNIENFHLSLTNFLDLLENIELRSRLLSESLGYQPLIDHELYERRGEMLTVNESRAALAKEVEKAERGYGMGLQYLSRIENTVEKLMKFIPNRSDVFRDKIEALALAVEQDVRIIRLGIPGGTSHVAEFCDEIKNLLNPDGLAATMILCKKALAKPSTAGPALQEIA